MGKNKTKQQQLKMKFAIAMLLASSAEAIRISQRSTPSFLAQVGHQSP